MATGVYKEERPDWCPHKECIFIRSSQGNVCGGRLPEPTEHTDNGFTGINTHQFCLREGHNSCFEVNGNDLDWFRWIFDGLDGKITSWISEPLCEKCGMPMTKVTEYTCDCATIPIIEDKYAKR